MDLTEENSRVVAGREYATAEEFINTVAADRPKPKVKTVVLTHDGNDLALVIDPRILDDWRFSMLLTRVEKDPSLIEDVMIKMLGETQYERLLAFYEDADGFVPASLVSGALEKLMKGVAPNS